MFRVIQPATLSPETFGVGSFIIGDHDTIWMIVADGKSSVRLLNMTTYTLTDKYYPVEDPNFLTQDEARKIVDLTKLNWTFTDFDLIPGGMKSKEVVEAIKKAAKK